MIFTLQPGVVARLPAQLLSVRLQVLGSSPLPELEALALGPEGRESAITDLVSHPGQLVLAVREPTLIRIRPTVGSATFPGGSRFGVVVGLEGPDADRAVLKSVDAAGLAECGLVTLTPAGPEILVTTVAQAAQVALPPAAEQARVAAREVVGAPSMTPDQAVGIRLIVDSSASVRQHLASGWVGCAIELISGVATVVSDLAVLPVNACGRSQVALGDHRLDQPSGAIVEELSELAPSIGFRSALVPDGGGHGLTFVITDAFPPDFGTERRDLVHVVLLGAGSVDREFSDGSRPITMIDTSSAPDSLSDQRVAEIVRSLLGDYRRRFHAAGGTQP